MTVDFMPLSGWHDGPPTSNSGAPRPPLTVPLQYVTTHYRGAVPFAANVYSNPVRYMEQLQARALAAGKSFEYNAIIPRLDTPTVWEYAGMHRAAHSLGENGTAFGVQFTLGVWNHPSYRWYDPTQPVEWEEPTDAQIVAYQWIRDVYLAGVFDNGTSQRRHQDMPGAATVCDGVPLGRRRHELLEPYKPEEEGDDDMTDEQCADLVAAIIESSGVDYVAVPDGSWATPAMPWLVYHRNGTIRPANQLDFPGLNSSKTAMGNENEYRDACAYAGINL